MSKPVFILPFIGDAASVTAAQDLGGDVRAGNLQSAPLWQVARQTSTAAWWQWNYAGQVQVGAVVLYGVNLSATGTWRVTTAAGYDSGDLDDPTAALSLGGDLVPRADGLRRETDLLHVLPDTAIEPGAWLRVTVSDSDNADGFIQARRAILGRAWRPTVGVDYGYSSGADGVSRVQVSLGGASTLDVQARHRRVVNFALTEDRSQAAALRWFSDAAQAGTDVAVCLDPGTASGLAETLRVGRVQPAQTVHENFALVSRRFTIQEV